MKKIAWSFLYLYVLGFTGYGIFGLRILDGVTAKGFITEFQTRRMPWEKKPVTKTPLVPVERRSEGPEIEIPIANLDNVG